MPLFMESRLKVIVVLMLVIFAVYTTELIIIQGKNSLDIDREIPPEQYYFNASQESAKQNVDTSSNDIFDMLGMLVGFLTFAPLAMPFYATLIMNFIMLIMWVIIIYIIVSIVYDFLKALPFT